MSCFWTFRSSDGLYRGTRTSFNVKVEHNHDVDPSAIQDCSNNTLDSFMIMNGGIPGVSKKSLTIPWCRNNASFQHQVVDGAFMLAFVSEGDTGGAPPFVLTFWAEAADYSCPVSPLYLSAQFGHVKLLKGRVASLLKGRVASLLKGTVASRTKSVDGIIRARPNCTYNF